MALANEEGEIGGASLFPLKNKSFLNAVTLVRFTNIVGNLFKTL